MVTASEIQHTRLKGELVFQDFCLKLIRRYWADDYAEAFGRSGQSQRGVDIVGKDNRNGYKHAGMQCKASETDDPRHLTVSELTQEVEKAKKYRPKLDILIVAYAGERDAKLQQKAQEITEQHEASKLFRVVVWSWPEIVERALNYPEVAQELLVLNEVPSSIPVLNPPRPLTDPIAKLQADVASAVATFRMSTSEGRNDGGTTALDAKLDVFRDQVRAGGGPLVVEQLRALVSDLPNDTPGRAKLRLFGILGAALVQAGNYQGAEDAFEQAGESDPETAAALAYKARAALFRDQRTRAYQLAELALEKDATNVSAANLLVESAPAERNTSDLEKAVRAVVGDVDVAGTLQRRYVLVEKDFDASLRVARGITNQDWRKDAVLGEAILSRFEHNSEVRVGAPLSVGDQFLLEEAHTVLSRTWRHIQTRPDKHNWTFVAANLGTALRLTGRQSEADDLAIESYSIDPHDPGLTQRCIFAHMHRNEIEKALALASMLADRENSDPEVLILAASVFATAGRWIECSKWAQKAFEIGDNDTTVKARAAELVVVAVSRTKSAADALSTAENLRRQVSPYIGLEARIAEIARRSGDENAHNEARRRLHLFNVGSLDAMGRFELADAYADDGDWAKAAELLEGLYQVDRTSEPLRRRLFYLYRADDRVAARALFASLGPEVLATSDILRLGAAIYERSGLLKEALGVLEKAVKLDARDLRSRLDWIRIAIRGGDEQKVVSWIKKAKLEFEGQGDEYIELAQLLDRYGRRKDALRVGFKALIDNWASSERTHMGYLSLFLLHFEKDKFLEIKKVQQDAVVVLENNLGERARYFIGTDNIPGRQALQPVHPFAKSLLGKANGDSVTLEGIGQPVTWTIVDVLHKYVDLFREALDAHSRLFPSSRAMGRFTIDAQDDRAFEPIFEQARERSRLVSDTVRLYTENPIPIDTVAKILGTDNIDASRGLRFVSNTLFDSCLGDHTERDLAFQNLTGRTSFLVDTLTLALWQEIGLLEVIENLHIKVKVVQATIDELAQREDDARQAIDQRGGSLEARDDGFVMIEPSAEQRVQLWETNRVLLNWVREHADILPTSSLPDQKDNIDDYLSSSAIDSIATAIDTGLTLIIEDRRLRILAAEFGARNSSWTQPLLTSLRAQSSLRSEDYVRLLVQLRQQRIGFVSIGASDLIAAHEVGKKEYSELVGALIDTGVDPGSLVSVASEFGFLLWQNKAYLDEREHLFSEIFNGALRRSDGVRVITKIAKTTYEALRDDSGAKFWIARFWDLYFDGFLRGHFIRDLVVRRG